MNLSSFDPKILNLYFIAGTQDCRHLAGNRSEHLLNILHQALQSGISCYQFRDKGVFSLQDNPSEQKQLAKECQRLCQRYGVPFILNDMVELAFELGVDGIHVGQGDKSIIDIAQEMPKPMILGLSVNTLEQARYWNSIPQVSYFGTGPIFPTQSKSDQKPAVGIEFPKTLRQAGIQKPFVAIGGITHQSAQTLRTYGANGVAIISAITQADNITTAVEQLK